MLKGWMIVSCSLLLLFFLSLRVKWNVLVEVLSLFSFRLAIAFLFLLAFNFIGGYFALDVPINLFSAFIIACLGVPGICSVGLINYFL